MTEPDGARPDRRIPQLDGLRGLAISLVLVWHYAVNQINAKDFPFMDTLLRSPLGVTWSGVDLFFVLSGFLIGGILIDQRESASLFRTFFLRRACRILPLYGALIAAFLVAVGFGLTTDGRLDWLFRRLHPLWTYATFTHPFAICREGTLGGAWFAVTWSLAVEEQFYLALPFLVRFCNPRRLPFLILALIVLAQVLRLGMLLALPGYAWASYVLLPCRADSLLIGVLAAWALRIPKVAATLETQVNSLYWVGGALLTGVLLIGYSRQPFVSGFMSLFGYGWMAAFYAAVLVLAVVEPRGPVSWLSRLGPLRRLGIIAYGVYLLHQPVSGLCHGFLGGRAPGITDLRTAGVTLLALVLTLGLSALSYRYFEKPILAFGHRFPYADPEPSRRTRQPRADRSPPRPLE